MNLTRLRPRWWWRQLKCALGFHGWMMGPYGNNPDGTLFWRDERGEERPLPIEGFTPYCCAFSSPWCNAAIRIDPDVYAAPPRWTLRVRRRSRS